MGNRRHAQGRESAPVVAAVWLLTALFSAAPGLLLLVSAESGLPKGAGLALLAAGVVAAGTGVAAVRGASTLLRGSSPLVVLLCLASLIALEVDGRLSAAGWVFFGGAAAVLAVLAGALTLRVSRRTQGG